MSRWVLAGSPRGHAGDASGVGFPVLVALLILTSLATLSCSTDRQRSRVNILLISMDTTRRDHCSVYGYAVSTTPNLRRLAAKGVQFDLAYAPISLTGPSHASVFTSLYPITHGVTENAHVLAEEFTTLAEALRSAGFQTAGIVSAFVMDAKFGLSQGFDVYDDEFPPGGATLVLDTFEGHRVEGAFDRRADVTTRRAIGWLESERNPDQPFFLFVHYFDPHEPYLPPREIAKRFAPKSRRPRPLEVVTAQYDAEIAFVDQEIGRLLDAVERLGLTQETLVVVMADHGEGLMDHGHLLHGIHVYEEQVRVPLIVSWQGHIPAPRLVTAPVELLDLTPTLLNLAGVDLAESDWRGQNLSRILLDGTDGLDPDRPIYLYQRPYDTAKIGALVVDGDKRGVRVGSWKYILSEKEQTEELFNLVDDPEELRNLSRERPERTSELGETVRAWVQSESRPVVPSVISEEDRERLRSLGYLD